MTTVKIHVDPTGFFPTSGTAGAACYDLYAVEAGQVHGGDTDTVGTGVYLEVPPGWEAVVRGRSGLASGCGIIAHHGTIDSDYRGEVMVILHNTSDCSWSYKRGDRIAQIAFRQAPEVTLEPAGVLSKTERGASGLGSTGK